MDSGRTISITFVLLACLSLVPAVDAAIRPVAEDEGYHDPLYTDTIENAETGKTALVVDQPALEVGSGNLIINTQPAGSANIVTSDSVTLDAGTGGSMTFDGNQIDGSSSLIVGTPLRLSAGTSVNTIATTRVNDTSTLITGNAIESGLEAAKKNATQTIGEVLDEGNVAYDTQRMAIDGIRARDADGLFLSNDANNPGVFIDDAGQVGVRTSSPSSALTVGGQIQTETASQGIYLPGGTGIQQFITSITGSGNDYSVPTTAAVADEDDAVNASATQTISEVLSEGDTANDGQQVNIDEVSARDADGVLVSDDASNPGVFIADGGNVGIGNTAPSQSLDVAGSAVLDAGTNVDRFSTDESLSDNSDDAVPTEQAVRQYVLNNQDGYLPDDPATSNVDFSGYNANNVGTVNADDVQLNTGTTVNEFSTDESLSDNSDDATPTEQAVKQYVDGQVSTTDDYLPDDPATSSVNMQGNPVQNLPSPSDNQDAVRKEYVDKQEISTSGCTWTSWTAGETQSGPQFCGSNEVMSGVEIAGENDAGEYDCDDHEPNDANAWCVRAYCCNLNVDYVPDVVASIDFIEESTSSGIPSAYDVGTDVSNTGTDSDTFDVTITGEFTNSSAPLTCSGVSGSYSDTVTLNGGDSTSVSGTVQGTSDCPELRQVQVSMIAQSTSSSDYCTDNTPTADGKSC